MNNLRQVRKELGFTQRCAAKLIGIKPEALCAYESDKLRPHQKMRAKIELGLNRIIDWETGFKLHTLKDAKLALHQLVKSVSGLLNDEEHSQMIDAIIEQVQILKVLRKPKPPVVYGQVFRSETKKLIRTRYNGNNIAGNSSKPIYI